MLDEILTHATFALPKPEVHGQHPFKNNSNHERLLQYILSRLRMDKPNRDNRVQRYSQIDRDLAAWLRLTDDDRKAMREHVKSGKSEATEISLPLAFIHIDDMMTYYAQTFAPNRGMFYHTAKPDDAIDAEQVIALMNNHAIYGGYYRQLLLTILSTLKYNLGGLTTKWSTDFGPKVVQNEDGTQGSEQEAIFRGNKAVSIDMYNAFYDSSVDPTMLYCDGEWFAQAMMKSHYWLKNKSLQGMYYNTQEMLDNNAEIDTTFTSEFYKHPPAESQIESDESGSANQSWAAILSGSTGYIQRGAFELVEIHVRINPNDFGLIPGNAAAKASRNQYEVWRFTLLNGRKIIEATYMNNIHNYIPAFFGVSNDDAMGQSAKSPAEILNPLQQFSSFLLNTHVRASSKNLFGTTFYDPSCIDYSAIPSGEVNARIPIKAQGYGRDIRTMVYHDNNTLDTKQTLQDLQGVMGLVDQFFPTQSLPSAIAGIDRAIDSQVAAVQQGSNRRQHKGARLLDDTLMRPLRFSLYYNILQYQVDDEEIADYFGNTITVKLDKLRTTNLSYIIGQGLKAIDRQAVAQQMQGLFFALLQSPVAGQQVDILKMLGFWMSMMDIEANIEDFRLPPQPAVGPDGQPVPADPNAAAVQDGTGIVPATNPASLTSPIYG